MSANPLSADELEKFKTALTERRMLRNPGRYNGAVLDAGERDLGLHLLDEYNNLAKLVDDAETAIRGAAALKTERDALTVEVERMRTDLSEEQALREKLSSLLNRTAVALKGPEPELVLWDWSDLPEIAKHMRHFIDVVLKYDNDISETSEQSREDLLAAIREERKRRK